VLDISQKHVIWIYLCKIFLTGILKLNDGKMCIGYVLRRHNILLENLAVSMTQKLLIKETLPLCRVVHLHKTGFSRTCVSLCTMFSFHKVNSRLSFRRRKGVIYKTMHTIIFHFKLLVSF